MNTTQRFVLALVGVLLVLGLAAAVFVDRPTRLDEAIARLGDDDRFATSAEAGQTVADISVGLRQDGAACRSAGDETARCAALLSAAAFSAVTAVTLLDCTAPDVHDARVALRAYLRDLRAFLAGGADGAAPELPRVVTC